MRVEYCQMALLLLWQKELGFFSVPQPFQISVLTILTVAVIFNLLYLFSAGQRLGEVGGGEGYRKLTGKKKAGPIVGPTHYRMGERVLGFFANKKR